MESKLSSLICRSRNMHVDNKWGSCFRFLWHSRKVSSKTCSRVGNKRGIPKLPLISLINIAHMRSGGSVSNIKLCNNYQKISSVLYWFTTTLLRRLEKHQSCNWVQQMKRSRFIYIFFSIANFKFFKEIYFRFFVPIDNSLQEKYELPQPRPHSGYDRQDFFGDKTSCGQKQTTSWNQKNYLS